ATADPHFERNIRNGNFAPYKYEVSADNYLRYQGKFDFSKYCQQKDDMVVRDSSLVQHVHFLYNKNNSFEFLPDNIQLIIFRNQLIYYTQSLQDRVLKTFYDKLSKNGILAIGVREQLGIMSQQLFRIINESEHIYGKN
ncbi:MAG: CheR family methyltransferase, partial [Bacteroidales bacterium]